jgi:hypothetical protein
MKAKEWTADELDGRSKLSKRLGHDELIAARVGRTRGAVQAKRAVLGIEAFRQTAQGRDGGSRR